MSRLIFELEARFIGWGWILRQPNHTIIASSKTYTRKSDVRRAIKRLRTSVVSADVKDVSR
jgi:uncharacterized protein YegP (UPF0339 family)